MSYDPRFGPGLDTFLVRVDRNESDMAAFELAARLFLREVADELESLKGLASYAV